MWSYLFKEPDALALALLLLLLLAAVASSLTLVLGRRREARRAATGAAPGPEQEQVTTWPHLLRLELLAALVVLLLLSWWALALDLPLGRPADPRITPALTKAPWFFVGIQEMLQYFDPWLAGALLPPLMVLGLALLPYLDPGGEGAPSPEKAGWPAGGLGVPLLVLGLITVFWLVPMVVGLLYRSEHWALGPVWRDGPWHLLQQQDAMTGPAHRSLAGLAGLAPDMGAVLGGVVVLGPYALLALVWAVRRSRRGPGEGKGPGRFLLAGALLVTLGGVAIKVALMALLDVQYIWVTPWFRV